MLIDDGSWAGFYTDRASGIIISKVNETLTPNLNGGLSILWSMVRLDCRNMYWLIISEINFISNILESSIKRNSEFDINIVCF